MGCVFGGVVASVESVIIILLAAKTIITRYVSQTIGAFLHMRKPEPNLSVLELKVMKSLRNRNDLIFAPANRGRVVAVMDKEAYHGKVISQLEDGKTCEKLPDDPTSNNGP